MLGEQGEEGRRVGEEKGSGEDGGREEGVRDEELKGSSAGRDSRLGVAGRGDNELSLLRGRKKEIVLGEVLKAGDREAAYRYLTRPEVVIGFFLLGGVNREMREVGRERRTRSESFGTFATMAG